MTDDTQAIANLVYSYAELFDTGDLERMAQLFSDGVVRTAGSDHGLRGASAVFDLIEQTVQLYDGVPCTKHLVTNLIIEVSPDGDSATARSYFTAMQARPDLTLQPILAGKWHDTFDKSDGRWRFVDRQIHADLFGDVSCHLKGLGQ